MAMMNSLVLLYNGFYSLICTVIKISKFHVVFFSSIHFAECFQVSFKVIAFLSKSKKKRPNETKHKAILIKNFVVTFYMWMDKSTWKPL